MQVLFTLGFLFSSAVILHDCYAYNVMENYFPWVSILMKLILFSLLLILFNRGFADFGIILCAVLFLNSYHYETIFLKKGSFEMEVLFDWLFFITLKIGNVCLLYFCAKKMMDHWQHEL